MARRTSEAVDKVGEEEAVEPLRRKSEERENAGVFDSCDEVLSAFEVEWQSAKLAAKKETLEVNA